MKKYFLVIFLIVSSCFALAQKKQIDSLLTLLKTDKEDTNKINTLLLICCQDGTITDSTRKEYSEIALQLSEKLNYQTGKTTALITLAISLSNTGNYDKALKYLNKALDVSKSIKNYKQASAQIYNVMGGSYYHKGDYNTALIYYLKSIALNEELRNKNKVADIEYNISLIYYQNKEFGKATEYTKKAYDIYKQANDTVYIALTIAQLGNINFDQANYEIALKYFKQSLEFTERFKDKSYSLINLIGIGDVLNETKKYSDALVYHKKALEIAKELNDEQNEAICLMNVGHTYAYIGKFKDGIILLKQAVDLSRKIGIKKPITDAYAMLYEVFGKEKDYIEAFKYSKLYIGLNDSIYKEENAEQINNLSAKYESEKKEKEIAILKVEQTITEAQHKRKQLIYATVILIITMMAFFIISRQRLKTKNNKILFEKQEALLQAEKQKAEDELLNAKKLLDNYTENLIDKNKAIEELQYQIEKLKGLKAAEIYKEKIDNLDDLNNATILTNEDWEKFKELFEQVYKGFFIRLKDKLPNLTNAETRLISLIKLNLDTKQMAAMLGVSPNTIKVTKYRLRKKIDLPENEDIDSLIESI